MYTTRTQKALIAIPIIPETIVKPIESKLELSMASIIKLTIEVRIAAIPYMNQALRYGTRFWKENYISPCKPVISLRFVYPDQLIVRLTCFVPTNKMMPIMSPRIDSTNKMMKTVLVEFSAINNKGKKNNCSSYTWRGLEGSLRLGNSYVKSIHSHFCFSIL